MPPDPKEGRRIVDPEAGLRMILIYGNACAACGREAGNTHHVVQKGSPHFGDDVIENLVPLCGTGTMRCHGALHGSAYVVVPGVEKRTGEWVAKRIGLYLVTRRPDVIAYVRSKLGPVAGDEYLRRFYLLEAEQLVSG